MAYNLPLNTLLASNLDLIFDNQWPNHYPQWWSIFPTVNTSPLWLKNSSAIGTEIKSNPCRDMTQGKINDIDMEKPLKRQNINKNLVSYYV